MKKFAAIIIALLCPLLVACGSVEPDRTIHNDDDAVALITVYSTDERGKVAPGLTALGHAYTSVKNVTDTPMILGKGYVLPAGETVTIASWEFDAHAGVWYNIEPTYIDQGWFVMRKSITRAANEQTLEKLNAYLTDPETDRWTLFDNCTHFAAGLWNAVSDGSGDTIDTDGMLTPSDLQDEILRFHGSEIARPHVSSLPTGYFEGDSFKEFKLA